MSGISLDFSGLHGIGWDLCNRLTAYILRAIVAESWSDRQTIAWGAIPKAFCHTI